MVRKLFFLLPLLLLVREVNARGTLASAPIQGHTTSYSTQVWLMVRHTDRVELSLKLGSETAGKKTVDVSGVEFWKGFAPLKVEFSNLQPGSEYQLEIALDGQPLEQSYPIRTHRADQRDYSFMVGSCALYLTGPPKMLRPNRNGIFQAMTARPTDFMLWLGDNTYLLFGEWEKASRMQEKYTKVRLQSKTNAFLRSRPNYAIWDDHDFGPDNGDASFFNKKATLANFKDFWANPYWGTPETPGIFSHFRHQDSEFFLLDDRYYRVKPNHETMLGAGQLQWLKDHLKASTATFKFIAHGSQVTNPVNSYECFRLYEELEDLLEFIRTERITGVVFLSGDRHFTELLRWKREGMYPLYEFTCSPISSLLRKSPGKEGDPEYNNPNRIDGTLYMDYNFGTVSVDGPEGMRTCTLRSFDDKGDQVWEYTIKASELRW